MKEIKSIYNLIVTRYKKIINIVLILVLVVTSFILLIPPKQVSADWWGSLWRYRKPIEIKYSESTPLYDYQVLIDDFDTATLVTAGKLQSDCDDIRFADLSGNELSYWIESGCNTSTTDIWVKVNKIKRPANTIYMYYGNSSANAGASGDDTFMFFEDFDGETISSLESDGWVKNYGTDLGYASAPSYSIVSGELFMDNNYGYGSSAYFTYDGNWENFILHGKAKQTAYYIANYTATGISFRTVSNPTENAHPTPRWGASFEGASTEFFHGNDQGASANGTGTFSQSIWYDIKIVAAPTNSKFYLDGSLMSTVTDSSNSGGVGFSQYEAEAYYDDVFIRQYAATEPTIGDPQTEEISKSTSLHLSFDEGYGTTAYNRVGTSVKKDPVGYWKFDEGALNQCSGGTNDVCDETLNGNDGSENGTMTDGDWVDGVHGKAIDLDGTDDYISITDPADGSLDMGTADFTMMTWVKGGSGMNTGRAISKRDGNTGYELVPRNDVVSVQLGDGTDYFHEDIGSTTITDSVWHHIAASIDRTNEIITVYVDGVEDGTYDFSGDNVDSVDNSANIQFGNYGAGYFQGQLDETKIYNYKLSSTDIWNEYQSTNGHLMNMDPTTDWVSGVATQTGLTEYGKALDFDGSNDYVSFGDPINGSLDFGTGDFTLSAWINTSSSVTQYIICKKATSGAGYDFYVDSSGRIYARASDASDTFSRASTGAYNDGNWHHITMVADKSDTLSIYVDGTLDNGTGTGTWANVGDVNTTEPFNVGYRANGTAYPFVGQIDEVKVYPYARSTAEVQMDFASAHAPEGVAVIQGTADTTTGNDPVMHLKMDEGLGTSVYDSSGSGNHGVMTNMDSATDWVNGKFGKGLDFDGSNDYVDFGPFNGSGLGAGTIGAWVKTTVSLTNARVLEMGTTTDRVGILMDVNGKGVLYSLDASSVEINLISAKSINDGNWHYISGIWSDLGAYLYIDGVLENSITGDKTNILNASSIAYIGEYVGGGNYYWNGQIDDVKIYNYARSTRQIHEDMMNSPVAYWKFNEGYGTTAHDEKGNSDGTLTNMDAATDWVTGMFGKALTYDYSNDYVNIPDPTSGALDFGTTSFTTQAWVKLGSGESGYVFAKQPAAPCSPSTCASYRLIISGGNAICVYYSSSQNAVTGTVTIDDDQWHHIVCKREISGTDSIVSLYIDGELDEQETFATIRDVSNSSPLRIGTNGDLLTSFFPGEIDEVKIYNYALNEDEIKAEYLSPVTAPKFEGTSVKYGDSNDDPVSMPDPVSWWKMDEATGTGASVFDSGSAENTGTMTNMESEDWVQGKIGKALSFDGTNEYVNMGNSSTMNPTSAMSITGWVKYDSYAGTQAENWIIGRDAAGVRAYALGVQELFSNRLELQINGAATIRDVGGTEISVGEWYHVAVTGDSTNGWIMYINGNRKASASWSAPASVSENTYLGRRGYSAAEGYTDGTIDNFKIYNVALTPAQVAWEYNKGKPIFHLKMDQNDFLSCSGSTEDVCDSGPFSLHGTSNGTMTIADWVDGKFNNALDFDGSDDYVDIGDTTILDGLNSVSFGLWFNGDSYSTALNDVRSPISKGSLAGAGTNTIYMYNENSNLSCGVETKGGISGTSVSLSSFPAGSWYHIECTWASGEGTKMYINGVLQSTGTARTGTIINTTHSLMIASSNCTYENNWDGKLDDVRIYNYPLTSSQILQVYNNSAIRFGD